MTLSLYTEEFSSATREEKEKYGHGRNTMPRLVIVTYICSRGHRDGSRERFRCCLYLGRPFYITTTPRFVIVANNYYQLNSVEIVAKISILSQSIQSTELLAYKAFNSTNSRPQLS